MKKQINISAVNYLNTLPFIYGLVDSGILKQNLYILNEMVPADCAKSFFENKADIALVPIGAFENIEKYRISKNFCLSSIAEVETVLLCSNNKIEDINNIVLDKESRTSNRLLQIIFKYFLKQECSFSFEQNENANAQLLIGDKAFFAEEKFAYTYDLSKLWYDYTNLPFVFAIWVYSKNISDSQIEVFENALEQGMTKIDIINRENKEKYKNIDIKKYLGKSIQYRLNNDKFDAITKFLGYELIKNDLQLKQLQ